VHGSFACIRVEKQVNRVVPPQPLGDKGYAFESEELAHKLCILLSDGGHLETTENIASAKRFGNESSSISAELHQLVN
jgi:hypothetical protein